jgi:hypothetical protein
MSLEILARQSLKQFSTIYAEVRQERGDVSGEELEALMWEKITGGMSPAQQYIPNVNLIPSHLLKKIKVQLPYMPSIINYLGCPGLKQCGGLYVPCGAKCVGGTGSLCLICTKHDAKFGRLVDRGLPGHYMGGPKPEISYGTWLARQTKKEKDEAGEEVSVPLTIEDIYKELREAGFTFKIPEEQLKVNTRMSQAKRRPGRPGVVKKTIVNEDGTESPSGSSLDGFDHKVILGADSDTSSITDEETPKKKASKKPEVEAYAKAVTELVESLDMVQVANMVKPKAKKEPKEPKAKEPKEKKEDPVDKEKEKELANAVKEAKKAAKADEVARDKAAKELAKAEEKLAKAEKAKAEKEPKKEKKEPKAKAEAPKPKAKAPSPKVEEKKSEAEEYEDEDEEIEYEGVKYMLRGDIVYDIDDGSIKGRLTDEGDVELV